MDQLLKERRFLPYFITQFSGAFNDNLFKNGMTTLVVFDLVKSSAQAEKTALLAGAVFSLPFFIFSANAGQIADKFPKTQCIRILKMIEIGIGLLALTGLMTHSIALMFITLFLLATHSSYYGPIKYSILPEYLQTSELIKGNALVESGTFLAILIGTLFGTYLVSLKHGELLVGGLCTLTAIIGFSACLFIPAKKAAHPSLSINKNILAPAWGILKKTTENRRIFLSILGISWFWFIGSTLIVQLPAYVKYYLYGDQTVLSVLLGIFTIFVAIGCQLCNVLLEKEIDGRYCAFSMLIIAFFMINLGHVHVPASATPFHFTDLLSHTFFIRVMIDIAVMSTMTGIFVVPLFAILQHCANPRERSRIIAGNNIINAIFMALSPLIAMTLVHFNYTIPQIFTVNGWLNIPIALLISYLIPLKTVKVILQVIFKTLFRTQVNGLHHLQQNDQPIVVLANHSSFLDVPVLAAFLPGEFLFAVNTEIAKKWWVRLPSKLVETFPLDPTQPMQTKTLIRKISSGKSCIIFPEGRLTTTGSLMKMYEGSAMIAEHSNALLCPVWLDGVQFSHFTRLKGKLRQRFFPKITCTIHPLCKLELPEGMRGRKRRKISGQKLQDLMTKTMHDSLPFHNTLWNWILHSAKRYGPKTVILEDALRQQYTYQDLIVRSQILAKLLSKNTNKNQTLGFLLPNMATSIIVLISGFACFRTWAILNYSSGVKTLLSACKTASIKQIITARAFIEKANYQSLIDSLEKAGVSILYLEDLRKDVNFKAKISAWFRAQYLLRTSELPHTNHDMNQAAIVLFTSGSEGSPKGVVLSHKNLQENCHQIRSVLDLNQQDKVFNALPLFHAFGLTVSTLLPLTSGIYHFTYLTPLHYRRIPEWIYEIGATIMVGTNTFLFNYQKFAHPYDFQTLRYVFCGAEKLKDSTKNLWADQFGIRILEGYGATEASPTLSINTPIFSKPNSVGRLLPGINYRLETVKDINNGGKLWVQGNNVMLGYLKEDQPGIIQPPPQGWYDTGDIVSIDEDGFITIIGRVKRFAKIAGEMVSLEAVEQAIAKHWPDVGFAITTQPDQKKGEKLILCIDIGNIELKELRAYWKKAKLSELMLPKTIKFVEQIPRLATGKVNYPRLQTIIDELSVT